MTMEPRFTPALQAVLSTVEELERNGIRVIDVMVMLPFGDAQRVHVSHNADSQQYLEERKQGASTSGAVTESWYISEQGVKVFWVTYEEPTP